MWRRASLALAALAFALGAAAGVGGAPLWRLAVMAWAQDEFGRLTYLCDHAMRTHLIAKEMAAADPSTTSVDKLRSAEVGLIDCQDYDLMRKRLIRWGLRDNELSEMSLIALEERFSSLQPVIETHEIRY